MKSFAYSLASLLSFLVKMNRMFKPRLSVSP